MRIPWGSTHFDVTHNKEDEETMSHANAFAEGSKRGDACGILDGILGDEKSDHTEPVDLEQVINRLDRFFGEQGENGYPYYLETETDEDSGQVRLELSVHGYQK